MATAKRLAAALSEFARDLTRDLELSDVFQRLLEHVAELTAVPAAGVSLLEGGRLRHARSLNDIAAEVETVQAETQQGPGAEAAQRNEPVLVTDLRDAPQWAGLTQVASSSGVAAAVGIPFSASVRPLGSLTLYDTAPRRWSDVEVVPARMFADMATGYVVNRSKIDHAHRENQQLRQALENRVVIEQAKGILANHHDISVDQAYERLRSHARSHNVTVRSLADAVVDLRLRL